MSQSITFRLSEAQVERLARIIEALSRRIVGAEVTRSSAGRLVIDRGLDAIETELQCQTK